MHHGTYLHTSVGPFVVQVVGMVALLENRIIIYDEVVCCALLWAFQYYILRLAPKHN